MHNIRKHYTKVEYFSKHILFITSYLMLNKKLNHKNNSMQGINMSNFVQSTEHELYMYAKFECLDVYRFFVIKCLKF
jgi:hypothetical protein